MYGNTTLYSLTHALVVHSRRSVATAVNIRHCSHTSKMRRHSLCIAPPSSQSHTIHQAVNRFRCEYRLKAEIHEFNEIRANEIKLKSTNFKLKN